MCEFVEECGQGDSFCEQYKDVLYQKPDCFRDPEQNPQAAPEAGSECMNLLSAIGSLVEEWEAQGGYLNNPHDHAEDRAAGRAYQECAKALKQITSGT